MLFSAGELVIDISVSFEGVEENLDSALTDSPAIFADLSFLIPHLLKNHFPMQKRLNMRSKTDSVTPSPVISPKA